MHSKYLIKSQNSDTFPISVVRSFFHFQFKFKNKQFSMAYHNNRGRERLINKCALLLCNNINFRLRILMILQRFDQVTLFCHFTTGMLLNAFDHCIRTKFCLCYKFSYDWCNQANKFVDDSVLLSSIEPLFYTFVYPLYPKWQL